MIPKPSNERERLSQLTALTGALKANLGAFQEIAELAKARFSVPIALVSVIDATDQIYLGNCGIAATSASRDVIFCNYTILSNDVMVVEDTHADPRFAQHPFVTAPPHLRFYAGAPLIWDGDLRLGTICLADARPRSFSVGNRLVLEHMADKVIRSIRLMPGKVSAGGPIRGRADPA